MLVEKGSCLMLTAVEISRDRQTLEAIWDDGRRARFHALWLRDNCQDSSTRSPTNGQRLITLLDIPECITITKATVSANGALCLTVAPETKDMEFPGHWLKAHAYDRPDHQETGWLDPALETWDSALQDQLPTGTWPEISTSRRALATWLQGVRTYGVAMLRGLPTEPGTLCQVAELFGYVRETNYGRWFEVRSEVNPNNLAYTNLGLQAHTDNPYRDPVPTLQLLSCLENSVDGGESIVVDGFQVAQRLKSEDPDAFQVLTRYLADFEYAGSEDVILRARKPMIELTGDGELTAISFNNRSAAPFSHIPFAEMEAYYAAYRRFSTLVEDKDMAVTFKLAPGDLFIVDNRRVLHARKAFHGTGTRWLQGCYADKDGLLSTLACLEQSQGT